MVITVGRQYGSGGREIGTALANKLGIAYYDDLLLKKAAEESGLCEELFHSFDERPKSFLYSIAMDPYSFTMHHVTPKGSIEQQVYLATYDTIKKLADKGPCVLIGRCADYALADRDNVLKIFIDAPMEKRIETVAHLRFRAAREPHQAGCRAQQHLRDRGEGAYQENRQVPRVLL